jgi:hypothetical protein
MTRIGAVCLLVASAVLVVHAGEPARTAAVKKLATELADATRKGDYDRVIDHTHDAIVKDLGGREKAISGIETLMKSLMAKGVTLKGYQVGDPGKFYTEGGNTFVVVPTVMELGFPGGKAVSKSYLLGISTDGGKTWKFADGAGMADRANRERVLPKLPAELQLPALEPPVITKDK